MRRKVTFITAILFAASLWMAFEGRSQGGGDAGFTLESPAGKSVSLGEFAGRKPVLLVFWATWCPHCNEAVPAINEIQTRLSGRLQILAIDFMESKERVTAFVKAKNVSYPVLLDRNGKVARQYRVLGIPTYVVLDKKGEIVYSGNDLPPSLEPYL
ncbi:MAG TPA: TlpA disulfide reductase family protein [Candidatus Deferrimicrobiaceae bacterium]|nr:TlpA disulfide reductase family protein [Candidatus Deferrimicrobiaceae bacterium]